MEIGPFQRQYLDSVDNPHASAAQLLARLDALYTAINALMASFGAHGIMLERHHRIVLERYNPLVDDVMKAIHDLDGGTPR